MAFKLIGLLVIVGLILAGLIWSFHHPVLEAGKPGGIRIVVPLFWCLVASLVATLLLNLFRR
ncbi:MAG: DUF2905 domain-containing protein [Kiritimatiellia bacterium]